MSPKRQLKRVLALLYELGFDAVEPRPGKSRHFKVDLKLGDQKKLLVVSKTPNEYRGEQNLLSLARRLKTEMQHEQRLQRERR